MNNENKIDILSEAINNGIINFTEVRELVETMNRNKLEKLYNEAKETHKVWKGEGKDKRWKFKKADGSIVAKTSEEAIKEAFIEYQKSQSDNYKNYTFADLFQDWLDYRKEEVGTNKGQLSPSTYRRYQRDYERYIKDTDFDKTKITHIKAVQIEKFLKVTVINHKLTKKSLGNISGYIKGAFFLACKEEFLDRNPCDYVNLKPIRGFCKNVVKTDADRVLGLAEMNLLLDTLHTVQKSKPLYMPNYAVELATMTGMRVGEIVALKWECIRDNKIFIDYSEHRLDYDDRPCEYIIGEPKNRKHRVFPLTKEIKELLDRIKSVQASHGITSEFVFADKNGRINSHTVSCAIGRRCEEAEIEKRSMHAIRRTVSSYLRTRLPLATVANLLGHLEETNDRHYNYDLTTLDFKKDYLEEMFQTFKKPTDDDLNLEKVA